MKESYFLSRKDADGNETRMPIGVIKGHKPGERITVFGGQHGTEYAGIEAAMRLYREIDPKDVTGTIVISMATHVESLMNWIQFAPTHPEIADMMLEAATGSQYIINCHGGEFTELMHPYVICRLIGNEQAEALAMRMARALGVGIVSLSKYRGEPAPDPSGKRPAWWLWPKKGLCDKLGIPEITPEIGQVGDRDDSLMYGGIVNVLRELGFLSGPVVQHPEPKVIGERWWLTAEQEGIYFPVVTVGQIVKKGALLGEVKDFFGDVLQRVEAPDDATVMNMNIGMPVKKDGFLIWLGQF